MSDTRNLPTETRYSGVLISLSAAEAKGLDERGVPKKLGRLSRKAKIAGYDKGARTVTMAVSSETPVERYFGEEILSHEKGAIRMDRLNQGCALLFNHDMDLHLGRAVDSSLKDNVLQVTCRFGNSPLALEKERDVSDDILVDVSIGYIIHEVEITEDPKTGFRTYLVTDWELLEVSLVTVPADPTVGVGRSSEEMPLKVRSFRTLDDAEARKAAEPKDSEEDGDEDSDDEDDEGTGSESERAVESVPTPPTPPTEQRTAPMAEATEVIDLKAQEQARVAGLRAIRTAYPDAYSEDALFKDIAGDVSIGAAKERVADGIIAKSKRTDVPTVGDEVTGRMSEREQKSYSYVRTLRYAINQRFPGTFKDDAEAGFEREVSDSIRTEAEKRGVTVGGGIQIANNLPFNPQRAIAQSRAFGDAAIQQRTLTAGSATVGGAVINTVTETTPIELLRAVTVCLRLGATQISGVKGLFRIPRQTSATTVNWLAEQAAGTNSDITLDDITFSPNRMNKVGSYTIELLSQEAFSVEDLLRMDQTMVEALALDYAGLAGSGTNNVPLGLLNRTGLATVLTGASRNQATGVVTAGTGGLPATYVDLNNMEAAISSANADESTLSWALTPRVRAAMRSTPKFPSGIMDPIWPAGSVKNARGLQEGPFGYTAAVSNQLPQNISYTPSGGSAITGLHALILGYWGSLMFVDWGVRELVVDNITKASSGTYQIIENSLHDNNVRHLEHFVTADVYPS